jgi:hypothetical protein
MEYTPTFFRVKVSVVKMKHSLPTHGSRRGEREGYKEMRGPIAMA